MITLRQIERTWTANRFDQLIADLLVARSEDSARLRTTLSGSLAAAALGLIRLEELNQSHAPLAGKFLRRILGAQSQADGGWADPMVTALCIRALLTSRGQGPAIDRGIAYLADLQKSDGAWPATPIRRLEADGFTSAFILFSLASNETFCNAIRVAGVRAWFDRNAATLDVAAKRLWDVASRKLRCGVVRATATRVVENDNPVPVRSTEMLSFDFAVIGKGSHRAA